MVPIRKEELKTLFGWLNEGHSCAVIGPSNSGKSSLIRALGDHPTDQVSKAPTAFIFVDCSMAQDSEAAFYELLLRCTLSALDKLTLAAPALDELHEYFDDVVRTSDEIVSRSLLVRGLQALWKNTSLRLIILLDELDGAYQELPPWPWLTLRALRDEMKGRILFAIATTRRLERLRSDAMTYEFREMFHSHILTLRPLTPEDSLISLGNLLSERGEQVTVATSPSQRDERTATVLSLAGGHPGMIKRTFLAMQNMPQPRAKGDQELANSLLTDWAVQQECQRFWDELEVEEREGLLSFVAGGLSALDVAQRTMLETRGVLLRKGEGQWEIFSPLFAGFVRYNLVRLRQFQVQGVNYDLESGRVWTNEREITTELSPQDRKLLRLLYERAGKVCNFRQIEEAVWGAGYGVSSGMITESIKRLRKKIEEDPNNPTSIVNVRGEGYMLAVAE